MAEKSYKSSKRGINLQYGARSRKGETCASLFSMVYIFIKFHRSHLKIRCVEAGKHWAQVSKRGITERKGAKITLMHIFTSI